MAFSFFGSKRQKKSEVKRIPIQRPPGAMTDSAAKSMQRSAVKPSISPTSPMNDYATLSRRLPESGSNTTGSVVSSISISSDSTIIAVAWRDGAIALHDIANSSVWYLTQDRPEPFSNASTNYHDSKWPLVVFSPDGEYIASTENMHIACRLWAASTGQPMWKIDNNKETRSIQFSPDSNNIAWAGTDLIHICDVSTGQEIHNIHGHDDIIRGLHYTPTGEFLISVSHDASVRVTGTGNKHGQRIWQEESTPKRCSALSPDGSILASGDMDKKVILWDAKSGKWLARPYGGHSSYGEFTKFSLAFSADGLHIASTLKGEGIHIREVRSGKMVAKISDFDCFVAYSLNGRYMVALDAKDGCPTILKLNRAAPPPLPNSPSGLFTAETGNREHGGPDQEINRTPEKDPSSYVHESKPKDFSF